jgi:protein-S-isoprenylcysteine O-methyltransferase Ste14
MNNLNARAWLALLMMASVMGLLIFVPAGTLHYWQAWSYLLIYFAASASITLYLMRRDPALLQRRMRGGPTAEKQPAQKLIMLISSAAFLAALVVPALDHRYGWSAVPDAVALAGDVINALSFYAVFRVFRENSYAASTIQVAEGQQVIASGPYARVRHPMYAGASWLFVGTPLALGSWWGLLAFVLAVPVLIWRLLDEERFLAAHLAGYREYCARVRWRLLPGIF